MKQYLAFALLAVLLVASAVFVCRITETPFFSAAQTYMSAYTQSFTVAGRGTIVRAVGATWHKINWTITGGSFSACSVKLEQAADGSSWSDLIAGQTCTSNGSSLITAGSNSYVAINPTSMTGGGTLEVTWTSYTSAQIVKRGSQPTGSILTTVRADVVVTWPEAFPDANYFPVCKVEDDPALGLGLVLERIRAHTASTVTVQVHNAALGTESGTVYCTAVWP